MSFNQTFSRRLRVLGGFLLALALLTFPALFAPLRAQVEPELRTVTDTLDVYKREAGRSQLVSVMDLTTASRAVFETKSYLTSSSRDYSISNVPITIPALTVTAGKDLGFVFVLINGTADTLAKVALLQWPQTGQLWPSNAAPTLGDAWNFNGSASGTQVTYQATNTDTIKLITHVRFTVAGRTIDLPCPSRIFDSPYPTKTLEEVVAAGIRNYQKRARGSVIYDVWSETYPTLVDSNGIYTPALQATIPAATAANKLDRTAPDGLTPIGNFYYTFDFFTWIFNSKQIRNPAGIRNASYIAAPTVGTNPTIPPALPSYNYYFSPGGYAVPSTTAITLVPGFGSVLATGWFNGLSGLTRAQAQKMASINVYLNKSSDINWIYRFVDPNVDNVSSEEQGGATSSFPANPAQSTLWNDNNRANWKFLRKLVTADLNTNTTSLQVTGPSAWYQVYAGNSPSYASMDLVNFGNKKNLDPRTPQPWAYALTNTYYRVGIERESTVFDTVNTTCPGKTYVLLFPSVGFTDSYDVSSTSISQNAAANYITYASTGDTGLNKGNITNLPALSTLMPLLNTFYPGVLSSVAAFGDSSSNAGAWQSAWESVPAKNRGPLNPGIQTLVASVGIPGAYKLGGENNGRNPHELFFRVAQWSNPYRLDQPLGQWRSSNGNPDDYSIAETDPTTSQPGKVHYYPSTDATTLEKNVGEVAAYIVTGSASLSAPATPSTGARTTSQAYFGIFKTNRTPVWSGNLYSVGIQRTLNATTKRENLSFYGADGENTIDFILVPDPTDPTNLAKATKVYGLNNFDAHHLWSAFDIFGQYLSTDLPLGVTTKTVGLARTALFWKDRTIYTLDSTNARVEFKDSNTNPILVASLVTQFGTLGDVAYNALTADQKIAKVDAFINFTRGRHRDTVNYPTLNRIDIMGDIINSAPLAVEIGEKNVSSLSGSNVTWPDVTPPSTATDPHVRLILVGSNAGMLHCFAESASKDSSGFVKATATEAWAFIPPDMLNRMFEIYQNQSVADKYPHHYLVDGSPALYWNDVPPSGAVTGDTRVNSNENAVVIFGMRKGARSYYALSISGPSGGTPGSPKFLWKLDPQDASSTPLVKRMGASTAIPTFASISTDGNIKTKTDIVFIPGGYANTEINTRFRLTTRISAPITASQGLGQSMLALDPLTGVPIKSWDWSDNTTVGAISSAVTPVGILPGSLLIHRIYFADFKGNVMTLDSSTLSTLGTEFRLDTTNINKWRTLPRYIYQNSAHRFTTRPDAFILSGNYPVPVVKTNSALLNPDLKPMTAMVSIGSGDWNNPTDADESFTVGATSFTSLPSALGRMFVFADRQDSANLGSRDTAGILDTALQAIDDNTSGAATWAKSYSDPRVTIGNEAYFMKTKSGYYFNLLNGTLPGAYNSVTRDKVLVSPLTKEGALFFSIFNINGNTGSDCSSNTFTRTFRECDIVRPLAIATQSTATTAQRVGNSDDLNRGLDNCTGLAFYFNSLSSELADMGDRVIQGGAVTAAGSSNFSQQTGVNTPTLQTVKNTSGRRGFKLRNWRIVR